MHRQAGSFPIGWCTYVRTQAAQQGFRTFSALIQSQTRDTS